MEWHLNAAGRHCLQQGEYIAEVWQTTDGTWIARIEAGGTFQSMGPFPNIEDAQAWCISRLAELRRSGACGEL
jgi:hypothetical protein